MISFAYFYNFICKNTKKLSFNHTLIQKIALSLQKFT